MSKIACLFPGQGSQNVGMGKDFYDNNASARKLFEEIDSLAGRSLSALCFDGPDTELKRTINTQPTILAASLVAWRCFEEAGAPQPSYVAGHSLGEITALCAAQSLSLEGAVKLVDRRARLMEECPPGAMSAVIGMSAGNLESTCREASAEQKSKGAPHVVIVANFNTNEQLVISGSPQAVQLAGEKAKQQGAKVIPLPVGGAFHSPLMAPAATEFSQELERWQLQDARFAVVQNVDARPGRTAAELKGKLSKQMQSAVRWTATIEHMFADGVDTFIEIGPGKALAGMVKKIQKQARVYNVSDTASLAETLKALSTPAGV